MTGIKHPISVSNCRTLPKKLFSTPQALQKNLKTKYMSKFLLLFAVIFALLSSSATFAQAPLAQPDATKHGKQTERENLSPEQRAQKMTDRLTRGLSLDERQASAVAGINQKYAQAIAAIRSNQELSRADRFAKIETLRNEQKNAIRQLLNAQQQQKFDEKAAQMKEKHEERMEKRAEKMPPAEQRADNRTKRMSKNLSLNEKQINTVREINLKHAQQIDEVRQNSNLSKVDKLRKMEELNSQLDKQLQSILTPEQYKHREELKEQGQEKHQQRREDKNK